MALFLLDLTLCACFAIFSYFAFYWYFMPSSYLQSNAYFNYNDNGAIAFVDIGPNYWHFLNIPLKIPFINQHQSSLFAGFYFYFVFVFLFFYCVLMRFCAIVDITCGNITSKKKM